MYNHIFTRPAICIFYQILLHEDEEFEYYKVVIDQNHPAFKENEQREQNDQTYKTIIKQGQVNIKNIFR